MDMAAETGTRMTERERPAAGRRSFRSKRRRHPPDVRLRGRLARPGTETVEPADVASLRLLWPAARSPRARGRDGRRRRPRLAGELARLGGLAVLNLEGVQTRFEDPDASRRRSIAGARR